MTRVQFIRELRRMARERGEYLIVETARGKGSHVRVRLGERVSIVQAKLTPFAMGRVLKQLGLVPGGPPH